MKNLTVKAGGFQVDYSYTWKNILRNYIVRVEFGLPSVWIGERIFLSVHLYIENFIGAYRIQTYRRRAGV
ncbi:MAG TPA: hypothetical protein DEB31_02445 [Clostridiales bacterium]|nr:hypothetical protein [Clostridiales bacterium]